MAGNYSLVLHVDYTVAFERGYKLQATSQSNKKYNQSFS